MTAEYSGLTGWLYSLNDTDPILLGLLLLAVIVVVAFIIAWLDPW